MKLINAFLLLLFTTYLALNDSTAQSSNGSLPGGIYSFFCNDCSYSANEYHLTCDCPGPYQGHKQSLYTEQCLQDSIYVSNEGLLTCPIKDTHAQPITTGGNYVEGCKPSTSPCPTPPITQDIGCFNCEVKSIGINNQTFECACLPQYNSTTFYRTKITHFNQCTPWSSITNINGQLACTAIATILPKEKNSTKTYSSKSITKKLPTAQDKHMK